MRKRYPGIVLGLLAGGLSFGVPKPLLAQETGKEFSSQRFDAPTGPRNYITTRGARTDGEMAWSAGLVMSYAFKPLTVDSCVADAPDCEGQNSITLNVVENLVQGDLMGSLTPIPRVQIGLRVPVVFAKGTGIDRTSTDPASLGTDDPIEAVGLGDPELEAKVRLYGEPKDVVVAGAALYVTAPLGHATMEGAFVGDETPGAGLRLIFDGEAGQFSFGANVGGILRGTGSLETPVLASEATVGSELRYSVAGGWRPSPILRAVVDMFGSSRLSTVGGESALELNAGIQAGPFGGLTITGGGGTSLIKGIGTPSVRALLGFVYVAEKRDRDDDAIDDADGCPDVTDNDRDGVPDDKDQCKDDPEDTDGFEDTDGCPDPDNDKDGLPDNQDECVDEPETVNQFEDGDGCPDQKPRRR